MAIPYEEFGGRHAITFTPDAEGIRTIINETRLHKNEETFTTLALTRSRRTERMAANLARNSDLVSASSTRKNVVCTQGPVRELFRHKYRLRVKEKAASDPMLLLDIIRYIQHHAVTSELRRHSCTAKHCSIVQYRSFSSLLYPKKEESQHQTGHAKNIK
jgi:hypothetical protein